MWKHAKGSRGGSSLRSWIKPLVLSVAAVALFRGVVAQAYQIPTGSMERTLLVGDYIYINKMLYGSELDLGLGGHRFFYHRFPALRTPRSGDVIVFRYPPDPHRDFIKRCVAVGGQRVELRDKVLFVDGVPQREPYAIHGDPSILPPDESPRDNFGPIVVPRDHLFMMGDNRDNSLDSRFWGPLPVRLVKGRAMFRYFSWDGERHLPRVDRLFRPVS